MTENTYPDAHVNPPPPLRASVQTADHYLLHGFCTLTVDVSDTRLRDYMAFQFGHFLSAEMAPGPSVRLSCTPPEALAPDVTCVARNYSLELFFSEEDSAILVVAGTPPKMVVNKFLILALRLVVCGSRLFICHAAAIGKDTRSDMFFGKGGAGKTGSVMKALVHQRSSCIHADDFCFFTNDFLVLGFPRYFSVKLNNYRLFKDYLTPWQEMRFRVWDQPLIGSLLRKLPFRFGHPPVFHVANFTYPQAKLPAATWIGSFHVLGKPEDQGIGSFLTQVNYNEFNRDFLEKPIMAKGVLWLSEACRSRLLVLSQQEALFWQDFSISEKVTFVADGDG